MKIAGEIGDAREGGGLQLVAALHDVAALEEVDRVGGGEAADVGFGGLEAGGALCQVRPTQRGAGRAAGAGRC